MKRSDRPASRGKMKKREEIPDRIVFVLCRLLLRIRRSRFDR
jgi:hypothetical protein